MRVSHFFHEGSSTFTYLVEDRSAGRCAIIDPVLDYDPKNGRSSHIAADWVIDHVRSQGLEVDWILETHAHADHLSAAHYLKSELGGKTGIGTQITQVQKIFREIFNLEPTFKTDGSQFDRLFKDGETFTVGNLRVRTLHTPGHTPACLTYLVEDVAFVGDTLFMPDYGTARADFPGGDAATLYRSIQKLLALPTETRLYLCHDYPPEGRAKIACTTTVAEQKKSNVHVHDGVSESDFVALREARDATLAAPLLLLPSIQVNIRAGQFPPVEANGVSYLKIPIDRI